MTVVEHTVDIDAPVKEVFEHCKSPDFLVDLAPSAKEIRNVEELSNGEKSLEGVHEVSGQQFAEECKLTWSDSDKRIVDTSDATVLKSTTTYTFRSIDGGTKFDIRAELSVPIPAVGK